MKIAISHKKRGFSNQWIEYCKAQKIQYKLVDCYNSDIIKQVEDCNALMWHFHQSNIKDSLFARQLLFSLEQSGKVVFPDFRTAWHFDDKVGQKYLLECVGAPLVPSYVFYEKERALEWINSTKFPKVFKLRGGAGSANVSLVKTKRAAINKVNQSFGKGFPQFDGKNYFLDKLNKYNSGRVGFHQIMKAFGRMLIGTKYSRMIGPEKGYVYFQEFIPNNKFDIRVIIVGNKAFAVKRMVRVNDFRASGSGQILYSKEHFNNQTLSIAFDVAKKMKMQCCAFDFVYDEFSNPLIVEISYGFSPKGYESCVGYWKDNLEFVEGKFNPYGWMVEEVLKKMKESKKKEIENTNK